jgi:hypothetical protein
MEIVCKHCNATGCLTTRLEYLSQHFVCGIVTTFIWRQEVTKMMLEKMNNWGPLLLPRIRLQMRRKNDGKLGSMRQKTVHNSQENGKGRGFRTKCP